MLLVGRTLHRTWASGINCTRSHSLLDYSCHLVTSLRLTITLYHRPLAFQRPSPIIVASLAGGVGFQGHLVLNISTERQKEEC